MPVAWLIVGSTPTLLTFPKPFAHNDLGVSGRARKAVSPCYQTTYDDSEELLFFSGFIYRTP